MLKRNERPGIVGKETVRFEPGEYVRGGMGKIWEIREKEMWKEGKVEKRKEWEKSTSSGSHQAVASHSERCKFK